MKKLPVIYDPENELYHVFDGSFHPGEPPQPFFSTPSQETAELIATTGKRNLCYCDHCGFDKPADEMATKETCTECSQRFPEDR